MTQFVEVKTADLGGAALDWAVAQIDEVKTIMFRVRGYEQKKPFALFGSVAMPIGDGEQGYAPSTCWHCGGPLIDKFRVSIIYSDEACDPCAWTDSSAAWHAPTPIIAACRVIVASVLGETASVPKELLQ